MHIEIHFFKIPNIAILTAERLQAFTIDMINNFSMFNGNLLNKHTALIRKIVYVYL